MSDSNPRRDAEVEKSDLMRKLSDKGIGELVEEICDLKSRLAMETKHRRDLLDSVRRLTDENGELRAKLALSSGQHGLVLPRNAITSQPKVPLQQISMI